MSEATYRFENAKTSRAGCQVKVCKDNGVKIGKGELRLGSLVTMPEYTAWKWKHWGCVTPLQIANMQRQIGGLEGLDLDKDLDDILDGFDELTDESKERVKYALINGHVHDDDWNGSPKKNRPGQKGINKRTPKKSAGDESTSPDASDAEQPSPTRKPSKKKATVKAEVEDEKSPPKKASKKRKAAKADFDSDSEPAPPKKRGRPKKAPNKDEEIEHDGTAREPSKGKARVKEDHNSEDPAPRAAKLSRSKKVKNEAKAENDQVLADIDKYDTEAEDQSVLAKVDKKQKRSRSKKVAATVPEDQESDATVKDEIDTVDTSDPAPKGNKQGPNRRSSRAIKTKA